MEYRVHGAVSAAAVADLFRSSGIRRPPDALPRVARMLRAANLVATARSAAGLVGTAATCPISPWTPLRWP